MTEFIFLTDNLYAVVTTYMRFQVASSKSAFLDAYEEPPWCVRERLVIKDEREKLHWGNNYHGLTIRLKIKT